MFKQHNIITAVELGTSKICVLIGEYQDQELNVIGFAETSCMDGMAKGEIISMDAVQEKLVDALAEADSRSGNELNNSSLVVVSVTGCDMNAMVSEGSTVVQGDDGKVSEDDICEATRNSRYQQLPMDRRFVNSFDAYYKLDNVRRVPHPLNHKASTLQVYSHVIHGNSNRLENFSSVLLASGLEADEEMIFAPIADMLGVLSDDELENGTLLIDLGAGTTEYAVVCHNGVQASGVLTIGFEHVANDLSVGLDLPINFCRNILRDGTLEKALRAKQSHMECRTVSGGIRKIPVDSFNRIVDARIREIFEIIRKRLSRESFWRNLSAGCVLTGGGTGFYPVREIFSQVCDLPSRIGSPLGLNGYEELCTPRYSTVYGALRYGHKYCLLNDSRRGSSFGNGLLDRISGLGDAFTRKLRSLRKNIRN